MIDIKRFNELEKELHGIKDTILKQVWLVHHIVGVDIGSNCNDVLINIDRVYETIDRKTGIPYVVIMSHDFVREFGDMYRVYESFIYIKKELFDMTEEELRANKDRLVKELEESNSVL